MFSDFMFKTFIYDPVSWQHPCDLDVTISIMQRKLKLKEVQQIVQNCSEGYPQKSGFPLTLNLIFTWSQEQILWKGWTYLHCISWF